MSGRASPLNGSEKLSSARPVAVGRGAGLTVGLAVVMMCCLVAGPALSKGRGSQVQVSLVEASRVLPPYVSATYAAQCPSSHPHPVGGEFDESSSSGGLGTVALAASYPQGKRGWVVVVQNLSDQPRSYLAGIICLRANARFAYPRVTYVVDARGTNGASVGCPRAAPHAMSAYFNVQSSADLGKGLLNNLGTYVHGNREFGVAGVKSVSGAPIGMYGGAVCTSLQTRFYGYDSTVAPGMTQAQSSICPPRTPVAVGGFAFAKAVADDGAIVLIAMGDYGRKGYAGVRNLTDHPVPYSAGALCIG